MIIVADAPRTDRDRDVSGKEWAAENVFDVFGDDLSRRILVLASHRPVSAAMLADRLDASKPTIYRRVNTLAEYDLVKERIHPDREEGNHHKRFETTLKRATFEIADGGFDVNLALRRDLVDQFEAFWEELEESSPDVDRRIVDRPDGVPAETGGNDG